MCEKIVTNKNATNDKLQVLVNVPARVFYGNYWGEGKFEKVM